MVVDVKSAEAFIVRLDSILRQTENAIVVLEKQICDLSVNSGVDNVIRELKKINSEFEEQLVNIKKIKKLVENIIIMVRNGEEKIKDAIEGEWKFKKTKYCDFVLLDNGASLDWKIM